MLRPLHALSGTLCAMLYLQQSSVMPDLLDICVGVLTMRCRSPIQMCPGFWNALNADEG